MDGKREDGLARGAPSFEVWCPAWYPCKTVRRRVSGVENRVEAMGERRLMQVMRSGEDLILEEGSVGKFWRSEILWGEKYLKEPSLPGWMWKGGQFRKAAIGAI